MKVLGISVGRKLGNSEILLKTALKAVEEEGHEVSFLRLHDYQIKPCTGCELCTKLGRNDEPIHCMHKWEDDDFYFLMKQIDACDGLIVAAPSYHLMAPGILTVLVNRLHGFGYSASQANKRRGDPKLHKACATISVSGSDWNSLHLPVMNFDATELICSQMNLVDQMGAMGVPALSMVAVREEYIERAKLLGKNLASQLNPDPTYPIKYLGDRPEACPICHSDLLVLRNGRLVCAICDVSGDPVIEDGKITSVKWDGGIEASRFSMFGGDHHDDVMLEKVKFAKQGYVFTDEQKEQIKKTRDELGKYLEPVMPKR